MKMYRKKYLCVCEGQQEEMYLKHLASLIKVHPKKAITFNTFIDSPHRLEKRYKKDISIKGNR